MGNCFNDNTPRQVMQRRNAVEEAATKKQDGGALLLVNVNNKTAAKGDFNSTGAAGTTMRDKKYSAHESERGSSSTEEASCERNTGFAQPQKIALSKIEENQLIQKRVKSIYRNLEFVKLEKIAQSSIMKARKSKGLKANSARHINQNQV